MEYVQAIQCGLATRVSEEGSYYVASTEPFHVPPPSPLMGGPLMVASLLARGEEHNHTQAVAQGASGAALDDLTELLYSSR